MKLTKIQNWLQASRLPSQSYIFLPLLLGQSYYFLQNLSLDLTLFFLIQGFGIANQLYIVFANDYADRETDSLNTTYTMFSGGSRVIVENKIPPLSILKAAYLMAGICLIFASITAFLVNSYLLVLLAILALLLLQMYSYLPFRLSYRGGGEFLQMLGVGCVLPIYGYLSQGGDSTSFPYLILIPLLLVNLACAMATSLPDVPSDTLANKKTIAVTIGIRNTQRLIIIFEILTLAILYYLLNVKSWATKDTILFLVPWVFLLLSLFGKNQLPGTKKLSVFVFFSIAFNLCIQILILLKNFGLMD